MNEAMTLVFAGAVPFLCLGLLLWLGRLEETLTDALGSQSPGSPRPAAAPAPVTVPAKATAPDVPSSCPSTAAAA